MDISRPLCVSFVIFLVLPSYAFVYQEYPALVLFFISNQMFLLTPFALLLSRFNISRTSYLLLVLFIFTFYTNFVAGVGVSSSDLIPFMSLPIYLLSIFSGLFLAKYLLVNTEIFLKYYSLIGIVPPLIYLLEKLVIGGSLWRPSNLLVEGSYIVMTKGLTISFSIYLTLFFLRPLKTIHPINTLGLITSTLAILFNQSRASIAALLPLTAAFMILNLLSARKYSMLQIVRTLIFPLFAVLTLVITYLYALINSNSLSLLRWSKVFQDTENILFSVRPFWQDILVNYSQLSLQDKIFGAGSAQLLLDQGLIAHNFFLETLYDYGIVGLFLLLFILLLTLHRLVKILPSIEVCSHRTLLIALILSTIAMLLDYSKARSIYDYPDLFAMLSLLVCLQHGISKKAQILPQSQTITLRVNS